MQAITPTSPMEAGEMFLRKRTPSIFEPQFSMPSRPSWQAAHGREAEEDHETDFEDSESDSDEFSPKESFESDDRRRSQTTISSYEEAHTPSPRHSDVVQFETGFRTVQGPKGPHLFRASQMSSELNYDHYLQMSPVLTKDPVKRAETAFTELTLTPVDPELLRAIADVEDSLRSPGANLRDAEAHIRSWSTQQVIDWMYQSGIESSVIESFEIHDINGAILLDLKFEDLKELDIQSFGKRHSLWEAICLLRGDDSPSQQATPFQDTSRPCTVVPEPRAPWQTFTENRARSVEPAANKRRGRKPPKSRDVITPGESVSIVAIEEHMPRIHRCSKGEDCPKWRKQQRQLSNIRSDDDWTNFPISPAEGGRIYVTGDPGNAHIAQNLLPHCHKLSDVQPSPVGSAFQPTSMAIPSLVASSDLLGPGEMPDFCLQSLREGALGDIAWRDPQDNVKQFLNLQHMQAPSPTHVVSEQMVPSPTLEMFPETSIAPFPAQSHNAAAAAASASYDQLRSLPRLAIPRSASAGPVDPAAAMEPGEVYRLGTPASEADVPVTAIPLGPVARDASQSVPPNMQFRQQKALSRAGNYDWRRPSMQLPAVQEDAVLDSRPSMASSRPSLTKRSSESSVPRVSDPGKDEPTTHIFGYGSDCTRAGWMRKRRTKMLRHEWVDSHCRLTGTQLAVHENARLHSSTTDTIDVEKYAVACSTVATSSKLGAAMKALSLKSDADAAARLARDDPTAFAFQLVPNARHAAEGAGPGAKMAAALMGAAGPNGKTHHFAVRSKDDRIDWMRDLMLAKALQQKGKGYDVEVNGVQA